MTRLEARRIVAPGYAEAYDLIERDAIDIIVNNESLSQQLDSAPYGIDEVLELGLDRAWLSSGQDVPLFNCTCGDPECGGVAVNVSVLGDTIEWAIERLEKPIRFAREDLHRSLERALSR